jgi:hypothetical protein
VASALHVTLTRRRSVGVMEQAEAGIASKNGAGAGISWIESTSSR